MKQTTDMTDNEGGSLSTESTSGLRKDALENRARILKSAHRLFAEHGLSVTMDDIAKHCGVGVGTVYRRFPTKEVLIEALFEEQVEYMVQLAHQAAEFENSWDGFTYLLENFLKLESEDKGLRQVILGTLYDGERIAAMKAALTPIANQIIKRAKDDGYLRHDFEVEDVPAITAMVGISEELCHIVKPGMWQRYFTLILDGLRQSRTEPTALPMNSLDSHELKEAMTSWKVSMKGAIQAHIHRELTQP